MAERKRKSDREKSDPSDTDDDAERLEGGPDGEPEGAAAKGEPAKGEPEAGDSAEAEAEAGKQPSRAARRRGSAEVAAATPKRAAGRDAGGAVVVRAQAKYVRCAPRKARLVIDHIRGKPVAEARSVLALTPRGAARDILKLLESAIANAENNHELVGEDMRVHRAYVDEGPTLKRFRPRALGRATPIRKRTSHMTITLTPKE